MKKALFFGVLFFVLIFLPFTLFAADEQLTVTTYYPSPNGSYNELGMDKLAVNVSGDANGRFVAVPNEYTAMCVGDAHIGWSAIIGSGSGGTAVQDQAFAYDELNALGGASALPGDGVLLVKNLLRVGTTRVPTDGYKVIVESINTNPEAILLTRDGTSANTSNSLLFGLGSEASSGSWNNYQLTHDRAIIYGGAALGNPGGGLVIGPWSSGTVGGSTTPTGAIRMDDIGNVGIWTTNPRNTLDVVGKVGVNYNAAIAPSGPGLMIRGARGDGHFESGLQVQDTDTPDPHTYSFYVGPIGQLIIGDEATGVRHPRIEITPGSATTDTAHVIIRAGSDATNALEINGGVTATTIYANGQTYASDLRFKKNIKELKDVSDKLKNIRAVKFDWRTNEFPKRGFSQERQIGIIAQEMEKEFPELVSTDKEGYKAISYDRFTAVLLEAVKEQQKEIATLQKEVQELKNKIK